MLDSFEEGVSENKANLDFGHRELSDIEEVKTDHILPKDDKED